MDRFQVNELQGSYKSSRNDPVFGVLRSLGSVAVALNPPHQRQENVRVGCDHCDADLRPGGRLSRPRVFMCPDRSWRHLQWVPAAHHSTGGDEIILEYCGKKHYVYFTWEQIQKHPPS